ncbi:MAG: endonuclease Q family protein [Desulfobacterota bacterium]|nr:endonuclease Q family protein [Thermodesulfobacteriota bacterium]
MMEFIADLHIHSAYSRATSAQMHLENLHAWAQLKGITVLGTGDFTHPKWYAELQEKLEPAEPGLFMLKRQYREEAEIDVPASCAAEVRFILSAEVSTIYKKGDKTRKIHSLLLAPDFRAAGRLNAMLREIGNISSDGRPIFGIDCKRLLQMCLDASPDNVLIPAHIWTPHFSVLGAASGFDSVEECFEELAGEIFALETGLSSDPPMNWMLSRLDKFVLVSNSDAHSPQKLGREANVFTCELSYPAMRAALQSKDRNGFRGTLEFFPEEGKYHYDGHRACGVCMTPKETKAHNKTCPICGRQVTVGVMHRVNDLADRQEGYRPIGAFGYESLIPLAEILSEIHESAPASKKVTAEYLRLLQHFGNELSILRTCPPEELERAGQHLLAVALHKMRTGDVMVDPGYDGRYGVVRVFKPEEKRYNQPKLF